jgi:hypothetical protein
LKRGKGTAARGVRATRGSVVITYLVAAAAGCGAILDLDPPRSAPDGSTSDGSTSASDGSARDALVSDTASPHDGGTDTGPVAPLPFCATADARVCTDFDDDASIGMPWRDVFTKEDRVGIGIHPYVTSDDAQPERGPFLVAALVPDSGAFAYHVSLRSHADLTPGWDGGLAPARRYELKVYVNRSDPTVDVYILYAPFVPRSLAVRCDADGGPCALSATSSTSGVPLTDMQFPQKTWVRLVVDFPPATAGEDNEGRAQMPAAYDVALEVPGQPLLKRTAAFAGVVKAPSTEYIGIGLNHPNADEGDWEVFYDDVALTY